MTTTDLVPVFTGTLAGQNTPLCNARDLHAFLQSEQEFANWIKFRIECGFTEGEDYLITLSNRSDGRAGRRRTDYHLTLDMAKHIAIGQGSAACGASPAPTGCAANGTNNERTEK